MNRYNILIAILLLINNNIYSQSKSIKTTISVSVPNLKDSVTSVSFVTNRQFDIEIPTETLDTVMTNGKIVYTCFIDKPTDISVLIGGSALFSPPGPSKLFEPGDSISIIVPDERKMGLMNIQISGRGSEKLLLLQKVHRPMFETLKSKKIWLKSTLTGYYKQQTKQLEEVMERMEANKSMVKREIYDILYVQTLGLHSTSLFEIASGIIDKDSVALLHNEFVKKFDLIRHFTDPKYIPYFFWDHKEQSYLALLDYGAKNKVIVDDISKLGGIDVYDKIIRDYYKDCIPVRNHLLAERFVFELKARTFNKKLEAVVEKFLKDVPSGKLHDQLLNSYNLVKVTNGKGKPFYNFELENDKGEMVKLSDFKGKVLLIDFYFYGCGPCAMLAPTISALEEKYKGKEIAFLSISIDRQKKDWVKARGVYSSPKSIQVYTNGQGDQHPVVKQSGIIGCPALFLVDENGLIAERSLKKTFEDISASIDKIIK